MRWRTPLLAFLVGTAVGLGAVAMHLPITDAHQPVASGPHDNTAGCTDGCDASHEHLLGHLGAACALIVLIAITVLPARTGRTSVSRLVQAPAPPPGRHPGATRRSSMPTLSALGVLRC